MIRNRYSLSYLIKHQMAEIAIFVRRVPRRKNKPILLFGLIVFCTITFLLTPQKAEAIVFNDLAEWGRNAAKRVAENQQQVVERYFGQYNPAFAYLCYCCQGFAIFPLAINFMRWLKEDDDLKIWIELVAPALVLIGLSNGGYMLGQIILVLYKIFDGVINTFDSYTDFYQTIKEGKARALIGPSLSPLFKQCEALVGAEQAACFTDLAKQAQNMALEYKQDFFNASWLQDWLSSIDKSIGEWLDPKKNIDEKVRTTFWAITAPAWEGILAVIMSKITEAWQALYGIAFVFAGISAPLAATASLFTSNTFIASAYALWLTGMFTIFLARLLLYIGYGLASDLVVSADASTDTLWFGVIMAFFIPFCVFAIAKGSASGVWASLVGTSSAMIGAGTMLIGAAGSGSSSSAAASRVSVQGSAPPQNNFQVETRY